MNKYKALAEQAREYKHKQHSCEQKKRFHTHEAAANTGLIAYPCPYCSGFHTTGSLLKAMKGPKFSRNFGPTRTKAKRV